ncbi:MAG TPA: hypothetical protein VGK03_04575 [Geothrix sp.]
MIQDASSWISYWRNARGRAVRVLDALQPEDLQGARSGLAEEEAAARSRSGRRE